MALLASVKNGRSTTVAGSALLYVYHRPGATSLAENDTLLVPDGWQAIRNSGNPFELNNATLQRRKGISMQQFVPENAVVIFGRAKQKGTGFLSKAHNWCDIQLRTYIRDSTTLGLLQAMLLGDESGFDPELRQAYAQTGVVHIVSISGTHVSVLYLVVTGVLFWIKGRRGSWIKYAAGLLLVWLYVLGIG